MKKFLAVVTVALLAVSLFAGGSAEKADDSQVTLKIANYAVLEQGYIPFWEGVKSGFEAKYPNYKIEWVTAPYGEIVNQVINMAGGGDRVDVIFSENSWVPGFEDAGLAAPVDEVLSKSFIDDIYPSVLADFEINGKAYGVPLYITPYVLYYNKDLFVQAGLDPECPPTTYDEMLQYAEKLSKLTDKNGNKVYAFGQTTASVPISGSALTAMVFNFGGQVLDENGNLSVDNEGFRQAFKMLKTLDDLGYNPQNAKLKDLRNLFALGQLAMYYDQSWGFNGVSSINSDAKNFTASAAPLKGGNGDGESLMSAHCFVLVDNGEAHNKAVDAFVQYVISADTLSDYLANVTPAYPATYSMEGMPGVADNPILKGAANSVSKVKHQVTVPALNDLNLELTTLAQAVTVSDKSIDQAIAEFKKAATLKLQ